MSSASGSAVTPGAPAQSLRRRLVPTVATLVFVAVCVAAGNWQWRRMDATQALRAQLDAATVLPPAALPAGEVDWVQWRFRPVTLDGTFLAPAQILLDNKVHEGHVGFEVVTPLRMTDGRVVLVNRGFVPGGRTRAELPDAPVPSGAVTVRGRVAVPARGYFELGAATATGNVWQHLDPARYAAATGIAVLPVVIEATAATGPGDALKRNWPAPDLGVATHLGYMVQWYAFAALALFLWVYFTFRRGRAAPDR